MASCCPGAAVEPRASHPWDTHSTLHSTPSAPIPSAAPWGSEASSAGGTSGRLGRPPVLHRPGRLPGADHRRPPVHFDWRDTVPILTNRPPHARPSRSHGQADHCPAQLTPSLPAKIDAWDERQAALVRYLVLHHAQVEDLAGRAGIRPIISAPTNHPALSEPVGKCPWPTRYSTTCPFVSRMPLCHVPRSQGRADRPASIEDGMQHDRGQRELRRYLGTLPRLSGTSRSLLRSPAPPGR